MDNNENMKLPENVGTEVEKKEENKVAEQFGGLPMESLICNPIVAAAQGQQELTATYVDTIKKLTYEMDSASGTKTLDFTYERPFIKPDGSQADPIKAPLISLVPVPAFTMDELAVDFNMDVKSTDVTESNTHEDTSTSAVQQSREEGKK